MRGVFCSPDGRAKVLKIISSDKAKTRVEGRTLKASDKTFGASGGRDLQAARNVEHSRAAFHVCRFDRDRRAGRTGLFREPA